MAANSVVVLGGGTGGIVAAHRLRRELAAGDRVVLVERDPIYRFAPSFLWVLTGERRPEQISADLRRLRSELDASDRVVVIERDPVYRFA
ncbi:MAG TPA: FAD-dependent oxidoreductase, partial [Gaiellaceae bacterium]|nr:FAD-dependent oxidoreductase [Gaiellaceae bacterium]